MERLKRPGPVQLAVIAPMAIAALVLGILGFCVPLVGILAFILGITAMHRIDCSCGRLGGRGLALGGAITGGIATIGQLVIFILVLLMLPAARKTSNQLKNSSHLRDQHHSMVIYASTNNTYLPGLNRGGKALAASDAVLGGSGPGHSVAGRYYILLNRQFISGELLINPQDSKTPWKSGPVTSGNYSYAVSSIADPKEDTGRLAEWRDTANSQAVFIGDRNTGASTVDAEVRSLWTTAPGDWRGSIVWGDNHAEVIVSNRGLQTRYDSKTQVNDNLFVKQAAPGTTEGAANPDANAFLSQD